ncbi:S8 family serine peptidase [Peribacillus asahii]|uniref:P4A1 serine protease n=1 Tax=Peribacillus asahii TaxID=228899 RepID=A0A3Q9RPP9_9BACI|nr:S8 family serine peptidase [Peribacillus asahii]AZV44522.1 P4A1 serine protease [Peribacillus asahii]USK84201.1 S8 family serine peptidase [Peribacillus asahii]
MYKFVNRLLFFILVVSFLSILQSGSEVYAEETDIGQVIVKYKPDEEMVTLDVPAKKSTANFIAELEEQPNVEAVEPNYVITRSATASDPYYTRQWYHQVVGIEDAWDVTTGSSEVVVAILDDGLDINHQEFKNRIIAPYDVVLDSKLEITAGEHGTHIAGIIAGSINNDYGGAGIAPNVKIMPINVFDGENARHSDVITAIDYAIKQGADIINLSLGGTDPSALFNEAIQRAHKAGLLIIAASGNDGKNIYDYPASYDHVIGVSATDRSDKIARYSNYGSTIDLAAPGTSIYSTLPYNTYGYMTGTSMATPIVAGVAALVWSINPSLTNEQIEQQLYRTSFDLGVEGKDRYYGYGRIDAKKAVAVIPAVEQKQVILTIDEIVDSATIVKGRVSTSIVDGRVTIYTDQEILATANLVNQNTFAVKIPKQRAGTVLHIEIDQPNVEPVTLTVIDQTSPARPAVKGVGDDTTKVIGTAEAGSTVRVKSGIKQLGAAKANSAGKFTITMKTKQKVGTLLKITATDKAGNVSVAKTIKVIDQTPPVKPTVLIKATSKTITVTGKSEAYSTVYFRGKGKIIGTQQTNAKGSYMIKISRQKIAKILRIYAQDRANNQSERVTVTF